jgi:hypothetical protein
MVVIKQYKRSLSNDSSFEIEGTEDDPAALIVLYRDGKPTDRKVGHKVSTLKKK